jgi:hypothetical protein
MRNWAVIKENLRKAGLKEFINSDPLSFPNFHLLSLYWQQGFLTIYH